LCFDAKDAATLAERLRTAKGGLRTRKKRDELGLKNPSS
jgi:hypothetical protein